MSLSVTPAFGAATIDNFLQWLAENPGFSALVVFGFACLEALVGVGLFVSSAILLSICTFLHVQGLLTIAQMLPLAFAGASLGDHSGFWLGRTLGPRLLNSRLGKRHEQRIEKARSFVQRFGAGAVFIGRFIPPIRSLVPLVAGISGLKPTHFVAVDLLAVTLWTLGLWGLIVGTGNFFS